MEELLDKSFRTTGQLELPHFSHWAVCRGVVGVTASQTAPSPNHPRGASTEVHVPDSRNSFARLSQNVKRTTHKHTLVYTYGSTPWRAPTTPALSRSEVRKAGCCRAENDCLGKDLHCVLWNAPECSVHCSFLKDVALLERHLASIRLFRTKLTCIHWQPLKSKPRGCKAQPRINSHISYDVP